MNKHRFIESLKTLLAYLLFLAVVYMVLALRPAHAGEATLTWTAPLTCSDGSAIAQCPTLGYNIEARKEANGVWNSVATAGPALLTYKVPNLAPGTWFFRMSTVTLDNIASDPKEADKSKKVDAVKPNPPTVVTVQ